MRSGSNSAESVGSGSELRAINCRVQSILRQQVSMCAAFDNAALIAKHEDCIGR